MKSLPEVLRFVRDGLQLRRFHTQRRIHEENIGKHSAGVAWFCWILAGFDPSRNLIMSALSHDMAEHITGDIPSPAKRRLGQIFKQEWDAQEEKLLQEHGMGWELSAEELLILKLADNLDGLASCLEELYMGNQMISVALSNFSQYTSDFLARDDVANTSFGKIGIEINNTLIGGIEK